MTIKCLLTSLIALMLMACTPVQTTRSGAVGVERTQYMMVSQLEAETMALRSYAETLDSARAKGELNRDPAQLERLRRISKRIIPHTGIFREDALRWTWEVNLIHSDEINAFCAAGGKIAFYTGIIEKLRLSDDEIAAVMGHEIAHALREHGREKMSEIYGQQLVLLGIGLAAKLDERKMVVLQAAGALALTLPHSREMEAESDRIGLELMARAGYNPEAAVALWRKMAEQQKSLSFEFLSTHPADQTRIRDIQNHLPRVMPLYRSAPGKTSVTGFTFSAA